MSIRISITMKIISKSTAAAITASSKTSADSPKCPAAPAISVSTASGEGLGEGTGVGSGVGVGVGVTVGVGVGVGVGSGVGSGVGAAVAIGVKDGVGSEMDSGFRGMLKNISPINRERVTATNIHKSIISFLFSFITINIIPYPM